MKIGEILKQVEKLEPRGIKTLSPAEPNSEEKRPDFGVEHSKESSYQGRRIPEISGRNTLRVIKVG